MVYTHHTGYLSKRGGDGAIGLWVGRHPIEADDRKIPTFASSTRTTHTRSVYPLPTAHTTPVLLLTKERSVCITEEAQAGSQRAALYPRRTSFLVKSRMSIVVVACWT